jgi:hypothetical protein
MISSGTLFPEVTELTDDYGNASNFKVPIHELCVKELVKDSSSRSFIKCK